MFHRYGHLLLLQLLWLLASCGTTVNMTGTWKAPSVQAAGYHKILVAGLSANLTARQTVESQLVAALQKQGVQASPSLDVFPPDIDPKNETKNNEVTAKLRAEGYDAVLTASVVNRETEQRYVPGSVSYTPFPVYRWYGSFWGYYGYMYNSIYSPGYYTTEKTYYLESNLYDLNQDAKLVWSGQSETYNPPNLGSFAAAYAKTLTGALNNAALLKK